MNKRYERCANFLMRGGLINEAHQVILKHLAPHMIINCIFFFFFEK